MCHFTWHTLETGQKYGSMLEVIDHAGAKFGFTIRYLWKYCIDNIITVIF
jgi:hypothetical protein